MITRMILTFGLICLLTFSLGLCAYADLVCYLSFDEGSGKVAKDLSKKGNDGQLFNNPKWVDGKDGKALQFSSSPAPGSYVEAPKMGAIGKGSFTAMAWYKIEAKAMDASKIILCTGSCCWNEAGFYICLRPGGRITFEMTDTHGGGGTAVNFDGMNTSDGQWHHIAGVYEFAKKGTLYVDGKKSGDDANMAAYKDGIASQRPLRIAEYFWQEADVPGLNFDGVIDEVAVFDTVLTEKEIVAAMELESLLPYKAVNPADKLTATWGSIKMGR